MAWWAPWTWFGGNKEEPVEGEFIEGSAEEQVGPPSEPPKEGGASWLKPWTWGRKGTEELEEIEGLPLEEEGILEEKAGAYRPPVPELEKEKPFAEERPPKLERKRPPKEVLVEEEELEAFAPEEEEYPGGLYISGRKIQGGFTKFCLALFSIFLLPFILVFGVCLATCAFLLVFPMLMAFFPILLIGLFMLFIIIPVAVPVLVVYVMATERSMLLINSKGRLFSIQRPPAEERKIPRE